jgi:hypothetical protein
VRRRPRPNTQSPAFRHLEYHLLGLTRIGAYEQHAAVAQPDMRDLPRPEVSSSAAVPALIAISSISRMRSAPISSSRSKLFERDDAGLLCHFRPPCRTAENTARRGKSGSQWTLCWRKRDSNPWSQVRAKDGRREPSCAGSSPTPSGCRSARAPPPKSPNYLPREFGITVRPNHLAANPTIDSAKIVRIAFPPVASQ